MATDYPTKRALAGAATVTKAAARPLLPLQIVEITEDALITEPPPRAAPPMKAGHFGRDRSVRRCERTFRCLVSMSRRDHWNGVGDD